MKINKSNGKTSRTIWTEKPVKPDNLPRSREKNVTGTGKDISTRGKGLGTGPVGNTRSGRK